MLIKDLTMQRDQFSEELREEKALSARLNATLERKTGGYSSLEGENEELRKELLHTAELLKTEKAKYLTVQARAKTFETMDVRR
jgi:hypothetical protein